MANSSEKYSLPAFGICALSVVPVRAEHSDKAEITTQLLFGEVFLITRVSEDEKWVYIETAFDFYLGWIDAKQFKSISRNFYESVITHQPIYTRSLVGLVKNSNRLIPVLMGSVLPDYNNGILSLEDESFEFQGEVQLPVYKGFKEMDMTARLYLSAPYLWGGRSHFGIDCSGLVQQVYRMYGINLPRDAYQQATEGVEVNFMDRAHGDLAFFQNVNGRITHVGILTGNDMIIHASGEVRIDPLDEKGIFHQKKQIYTHKLAHIRRVLPQ